MVTPRDRWLEEGLTVLAEQGNAGVRIDPIAVRLGLTKGSFHHHFSGVEDYHRALLERHEHVQAAALAQLTAEFQNMPPDVALRALPDRAAQLLDVHLERAVRSWATCNPTARAVQERLDRARLEFIEDLWTRIITDQRRAHVAALLPHLAVIGASLAYPAPTRQDMLDVFDLLARLAPCVPGATGSEKLG